MNSHPLPLSSYFGALADGVGYFPFENEAYPSLSDSRGTDIGIRSLVGFTSLVGPLAHSVLYPQYLLLEASPKAISGRTSYLQV